MKCGRLTEIYSRVCGYFRPVANWNKGKKEEFKERKLYEIKPETLGRRETVMIDEEDREENHGQQG